MDSPQAESLYLAELILGQSLGRIEEDRPPARPTQSILEGRDLVAQRLPAGRRRRHHDVLAGPDPFVSFQLVRVQPGSAHLTQRPGELGVQIRHPHQRRLPRRQASYNIPERFQRPKTHPSRRTVLSRLSHKSSVKLSAQTKKLIADSAVCKAIRLQLASSGESASEGNFVGVFEVSADGEAAREGRNPDRQVVHLLRDKQCCRLARGVRVGSDDELCGAFVADTFQELGDAQVFGFYPVQRGEGASEDVVEAAVLVGPFNRAYIVGVFDHADNRLIPTGVAADLTLLGLGQVEAAPARFDLLFDLLQRFGEPDSVLFLAPDDVEGDALGAPRPDGGQLGELCYQPLYWPCVGCQRTLTAPVCSGRGLPGRR